MLIQQDGDANATQQTEGVDEDANVENNRIRGEIAHSNHTSM